MLLIKKHPQILNILVLFNTRNCVNIYLVFLLKSIIRCPTALEPVKGTFYTVNLNEFSQTDNCYVKGQETENYLCNAL